MRHPTQDHPDALRDAATARTLINAAAALIFLSPLLSFAALLMPGDQSYLPDLAILSIGCGIGCLIAALDK